MFSANMLTFLLLAVTPLLAKAQHNQQTPLKEHGSGLVVPLTLTGGKTYSFLSGDRQLNLEELQDVVKKNRKSFRPQIASISIPIDAAQPGRMTFGYEEFTSQLLSDVGWVDTRIPGADMPTTHIGVRKGGMISKDIFTARLALDTPYISLPSEIYDILVQATNPSPWRHDGSYGNVVDCGALETFPDIVLGLGPDAEEREDGEDNEDKEIVITPRQYVLEDEEGKCILLVHRSYQRGREEAVLGWAAVRGKVLVLDWVSERTGFGR
ncbi:hypothetical protein ST47_g923 [Ascochyta rabiei]|uniref:Uncharacterized protein n=2 Tax=Didymella rabiei TaxID=5454 RepID=A0A163LML8_DIDRA|nr:hypothetical protein ST47_g923 [Ascochyta rabiei]